MSQEQRSIPLEVPAHLAPLLERVLVGSLQLSEAGEALGVSEYELGILMRALIRQRAREIGEYTD